MLSLEERLISGLAILSLATALASCERAEDGSSSADTSRVGEERTLDEAREDGCIGALVTIELNLNILRDMDELLDRGFWEWTDVNEEVWDRGDLVADYGKGFFAMGIERDTRFREAGAEVAQAYKQFGRQGFYDAGAQWTDAAGHFSTSVERLNEATNEFADLCPEYVS